MTTQTMPQPASFLHRTCALASRRATLPFLVSAAVLVAVKSGWWTGVPW
jgi:hypothetical protein